MARAGERVLGGDRWCSVRVQLMPLSLQHGGGPMVWEKGATGRAARYNACIASSQHKMCRRPTVGRMDRKDGVDGCMYRLYRPALCSWCLCVNCKCFILFEVTTRARCRCQVQLCQRNSNTKSVHFPSASGALLGAVAVLCTGHNTACIIPTAS